MKNSYGAQEQEITLCSQSAFMSQTPPMADFPEKKWYFSVKEPMELVDLQFVIGPQLVSLNFKVQIMGN